MTFSLYWLKARIPILSTFISMKSVACDGMEAPDGSTVPHNQCARPAQTGARSRTLVVRDRHDWHGPPLGLSATATVPRNQRATAPDTLTSSNSAHWILRRPATFQFLQFWALNFIVLGLQRYRTANVRDRVGPAIRRCRTPGPAIHPGAARQLRAGASVSHALCAVASRYRFFSVRYRSGIGPAPPIRGCASLPLPRPAD